MATTMSPGQTFDDFTPQLRDDVLVSRYDNEIVAWSSIGTAPVYLDPLAALVFQIIDGRATVAELITDINEVVGVPLAIARNQLQRVIGTLNQAAMLTTSPEQNSGASGFEFFSAPPNH